MTLALLFSLYLPAAHVAAASAPQAAGPAPDRGALYRVSDGRHTLHLFGTIHVGAPDFYPLEPRIARALKEAPALALELDPQNTGALQAAVLRHGVYPEGRRFEQQLEPALASRTLAALRRYQLPAEQLQNFRPWMLATALTVQEYASGGYKPELAVDSYLAAAVRAHGGKIVELESAERQISVFSRLDAAQQAQFLADTLDELDDAELAHKLDALVGAWRRADSGGFEQALKEMDEDQSFASRFTRQALLDERNPGLADGIAALLAAQDKSVAAIGILHLVGPGSVPELLGKKGLRVEKIY
ncbi:TraB/GumN family protein [Herbaspirillum sp. WKF16]|uniref:TraB/GumN family protein n=1 Tax=Herbaspirillum sp. WKF16 TaxID=3028312 RepID=UPI0023A9EB1A|nr:TraB/GumN family protein [Herbaspirillum sp. WKF16]WDZ95647.1 TraB/GumN family protein [Herbaspirillum sp. WKF16]